MIVTEHGIHEFKHPETVSLFDEDRLIRLQYEEKQSRFDFWMRNDLEDNQEKTIYKVGYLYKFLKSLYPGKKQSEIYEIMDERYHIFLGPRQIKRNVKAYENEPKFNQVEMGT